MHTLSNDALHDGAKLRECLGELSGDQRHALELAYFEGLTQSEIAERTGTPLGTVKTRTRQALRKMSELLADGVARPAAMS